MRIIIPFLLLQIGTAFGYGTRPFSDGRKYAYPASQTLRFDGEKFGNCLYLLSRDYPGKPSFSRAQMNHPYLAYDWFHYLIATPIRRFDYESGRERFLKAWILSQADHSLDPAALYLAALPLNDGQIWNSLLTIHQLLRNQARWWNKDLYTASSNDEEHLRFWNKMIDIRGDLEERGPGFTGDHEGSWYRLWGILLYRLSLESDQELTVALSRLDPPSGGSAFLLEARLKQMDRVAHLVSQSAEWVKTWKGSWESDERKKVINAEGAAAGGALARRILLKNLVNIGLDREQCLAERPYLTVIE